MLSFLFFVFLSIDIFLLSDADVPTCMDALFFLHLLDFYILICLYVLIKDDMFIVESIEEYHEYLYR